MRLLRFERLLLGTALPSQQTRVDDLEDLARARLPTEPGSAVTWTFQIVLPASPPTPNHRLHYLARAARVRIVRNAVAILAKSERNRLRAPEPTGPRDLTIVWHRTSPRLLDDDNAVGAMKPVRDAIADAGWTLGKKDGPASLRDYRVEQTTRAMVEAVTVTVREVDKPE